MKMIVGLGNPGTKYEKTRHNAGFWVVDELSKKYGIPVRRKSMNAMIGTGQILGERVLLVKPLTYMNLSGEAIRPLADYYNIPTEDILVIYDDIDIPFGSVRIRKSGSSGSHNGMKSTVQELGETTFPRIRISVGRPEQPIPLADYVLGVPTEKEQKVLDQCVKRAADGVEYALKDGVNQAMNKINGLENIEK